MGMRIETTTDTVEEVKKAIGEVADPEPDDLTGVVEAKSEEAVAAASESGAASDADDKKVEPQKKEGEDDKDLPKSVKAALGKLRQDRRELRERVDALEREKAVKPAAAAVVEHKPAVIADPDKPKREQFIDEEDPDGAYLEALANYIADKRIASARMEQEDREATEEQERLDAAYKERIPAATERYEDYDETFENLDDDVRITNDMQYVIVTSNFGPDISYYLAKNPGEAQKIVEMKRADAIRAMGRIEEKVALLVAELDKKAKPKEGEVETSEDGKRITKAPKPIAPLRAPSIAAKTKTEEDEANHVDHAKFDKSYEAQRQKDRKQRAG